MNKKLFFFAAALSVIAVSCKSFYPDGPEEIEQSDYVTFNADASPVVGMGTKAVSSKQTTAEQTIKNLQILVFNPDGTLNGYGSSSSKTCEVRVSRKAGLKCYALANMGASSLAGIATEASLMSYMSMFSGNAADSFHMVGSKECDFTTASETSISVHRYAAKISLESITAAFTSAALNEAGLEVKGIYLINANAGTSIDTTAASSEWLNFRGYDAENANALLGAKGMSQKIVKTTHSFDKSFYCYPNKTKEQNDSHVSDGAKDRLTRLVVEAVIGGNTYYYPVNILTPGESLLPNKHYILRNLKITGLGSEHPDVMPSFGTITYTIDVEDWQPETLENIEY